MGTPDFAVDSLDSIYKSNHDLCGVVTTPDKKAGRGQKMKESAVKRYCISNCIKLLQPVAFNDKVFINNLKSFKADIFVVVALFFRRKLNSRKQDKYISSQIIYYKINVLLSNLFRIQY